METRGVRMKRLHTQTGVSMIESLVAILVLAIGVMGLAGLQTRSLVETRLTNARANALLLANDLSERMRLNRAAALSSVSTDRYDLAFGSSIAGSPPDCIANTCTSNNLRTFDLNEWTRNLRQLLPGGEARIDPPSAAGQIRITFRWRNNVRGSEFGADDTTAELTAPLAIPIEGCQSPEDRRDWLCHQVVISP